MANSKRYANSISGRLLALTAAFALLAAGVIAVVGAGSYLSIAIPVLCSLCVIGGIFTVGLAVEDYPTQALACVLALPFVGGLYFAGLNVIAFAETGIGVALFAVAMVPLWVAARNAGAEAPSRQSHAVSGTVSSR